MFTLLVGCQCHRMRDVIYSQATIRVCGYELEPYSSIADSGSDLAASYLSAQGCVLVLVPHVSKEAFSNVVVLCPLSIRGLEKRICTRSFGRLYVALNRRLR